MNVSLLTLVLVVIFAFQAESRSHNQINEKLHIYNKELVLKKNEIIPFFVPLIKDLKKRGYPIKFVLDTLKLVNEIEFVNFEDSDVTGTYNKFSNKIQLENSFVNFDTGKLKKFDNLKLIHITTFYHEIWHAYYLKYVKIKKPRFYSLYQSQMLKTFSGEINANVIQNEAYGVFIGLAIQNYYQHYSVMKSIGKEGRHLLKHGPRSEVMVARYQEVLNYPVYGYYFNVFKWGVVDHQENLPQKDRDLIFKYVFHDEISQEFVENFSENVF